jgi:hypothetical protein
MCEAVTFEGICWVAVLLEGVMRVERGVAYLEDGAGRRVRMEAGSWQLPAPDGRPSSTGVTVSGRCRDE